MIRKLLIGATLSFALVSLVATAQGLELYIFTGNLLFAYIISAAVQGTLYTLSISGPSLIRSKKIKPIAKGMAILLWSGLLFTSSIFSFVYVSKTAYPDNVMRSDAEQNMSMYLQKESYNLLEYINTLEEKELSVIHSYISILNGGQVGFQVAEDDIAKFSQFIDDLEIFANNHDDNIDFSNSGFRSNLKKIQSGNYSENDMLSCSDYITTVLNKITEKKAETDRLIKELEQKVKTDSERLKTWSYHDEFYFTTFYANQENELALNINRDLSKAYADYAKLLTEISNFLSMEFEGGTESQIHKKTIELASLINRDTIDTNQVLIVASNIYDELIDNNTSASDPRIENYSNFRRTISNYRNYIEAKQSLESEITILGDYNQQILNGINVSESSLFQSEQKNETTSIDEAWHSFWSNRLASLLAEIQNLPSEIEEKSIDKNKITHDVMNRRRIYLVRLNDFDRAISLLRQSFGGFHEHGTMVKVSLVFAFGLDLFSLATGLFLSFFRIRKKN